MKNRSILQNTFLIHCCWLIVVIIAAKSVPPEKEVQALAPEKNVSEEIEKHHRQQIIQAAEQAAEYAGHEQTQTDDSENAKLYVTDHEKRNATTGLFNQQIKAFHQQIAPTSLHYIAVNRSSAREYTKEEQHQRMEECRQKNDLSDPANGVKCHRYAYSTEKENVDDVVVVEIQQSSPMSLILSSSSRVHWVLKGNTQQLQFIYVTGTEASDLSGHFSASTLRFSNFNTGPSCSGCHSSIIPPFHINHLRANDEKKLLEYFGKPLSSYQQQHASKAFMIN